MKKLASPILVACLVLGGLASESRAGSIDYLTNQSADFIRTLGRNAATDAADIVSHNPAGTTFLWNDGLYLSLSGQTILKAFSITYKDEVYEANNPTPFLPSFHTVFKFRNIAIFGAFTVPAGGGDLTYEKGVPFLYPLALMVPEKDGTKLPTDGYFAGSSMYLGGTFGAAYKLFNMVSLSAAMRVVSAKKTYKGWAYYEKKIASLKATKTAAGVGGIFGIHVRPFKYVDFGVRFETATGLEFETVAETQNLTINPNTALESFADGAKERRNLPAMMGLGLAIHPFKALTINANMHYYFNSSADSEFNNSDEEDKGDTGLSQEDTTGATGFVRGYDDDYGDGMEISFSVEYKITKNLLASVGYNHSFSGNASFDPDSGEKDQPVTLSDFEYTLDSNAFGLGARYALLGGRLKLTAAFAGVFYNEAQNETAHPLMFALDKRSGSYSETYKKQSFVFALAAEYRLF